MQSLHMQSLSVHQNYFAPNVFQWQSAHYCCPTWHALHYLLAKGFCKEVMWGKHFLFSSLLYRNVRQLQYTTSSFMKPKFALWLTSCIAFNVNHLFFGCKKSVSSIWCTYSGEGKCLHTAAKANVYTLLLGTVICSSEYRCSNFDVVHFICK